MKMTLLSPFSKWLKRHAQQSSSRTGRSGFRAISPWMLNLLFLPLLAFDLFGEVGSLLRAMQSGGEGGVVSAQVAQPSGNVEQKNASELKNLTQWFPFGGQGVLGARLEGTDTRNLPETSLNFQLHGILFIEGTTIPAFALIKVADGTEKVFGIGEVLSGDVRLMAVEGDRVILDRGGRLEALKLPRAVLPIRSLDE
ncbi:MAG: hypothetical protein HQL07_14810 [Nitrospirae bacterium]|nr:hypothetical protein [Magnetococcales bacterium]